MLAKFLGAMQKPGALKLTLAVAAATWGFTTIMKTSNEAVENAQAAEDHYVKRMAELAELDALIGRAENRVTELKMELQRTAKTTVHAEPAAGSENID